MTYLSHQRNLQHILLDSFSLSSVKVTSAGISVVVQQLRLCAPNAGGLGSIPGQETRSRMPKLRACMPQLKDPARVRVPQLRPSTAK